MKEYLIPAIGIIITTIILIAVNEFTETTFIKDYALLFIIAAMLLGVGLTKLSKNSNQE
jgi:ABC-type Mn2+/Zn2+ transport system permease subunit